jgi:hypothetical protein
MHREVTRRPWLAALTIAACVVVIAGTVSGPSGGGAYAQLPDSAAQRIEMLQELRLMNKQLADIAAVLREIRDRAPGAPAAPENPSKSAPPRRP